MPADRSIDAIVTLLDRLLDAPRFAASEPDSNGLLLRASDRVSRVAVAVNTSLTTIAGAARAGAELLVVHHASWESIDLHLHGVKKAALQAAGMSLYGAHASLDCATEFGTGWALARALDIDVSGTFAGYHGGHAGVLGTPRDGSLSSFVARCGRALGVPIEAHAHCRSFGRVAIVTGAGGDTASMDEARRLGADTYLTGEGSLYTRMFAREAGLNLIFGTHYATEVPGIKALAERVAAEARLPWEFIADSPDVF